jgi:hypothetical protein
MNTNSETSNLAKGLHDFLWDSSTLGGTYSSYMPKPDLVIFKISNIYYEINFINKYQSKVEITGTSK